jgi:hypothetical protein
MVPVRIPNPATATDSGVEGLPTFTAIIRNLSPLFFGQVGCQCFPSCSHRIIRQLCHVEIVCHHWKLKDYCSLQWTWQEPDLRLSPLARGIPLPEQRASQSHPRADKVRPD